MNLDKRRASEGTEATKATPHGPSEEDQFDAQEYVRQLIVRMGGQPKQAPKSTPTAAPATPPVVSPAPSSPPTPTNASPSMPRSEGSRGRTPRAAELSDAVMSDPTAPRRAPNMSVDIEKLREAVNISTSSHIQGSEYRVVNNQTHVYLLCSVLGMFLCMTFLTLSHSTFSISHLASIACLIGAGWATRRFIASTATLSQLRNREIETPAESLPTV